MQSTDPVLSELARHMVALASASRVYMRVGRFVEAVPDMHELTEQIHGLLVQVFDDVAWKRFFAAHEPMPPRGIEAGLEPLEIDDAAAFITSVATVDLVWPSHRLVGTEDALRAARSVVSVLGADATWWTNHDAHCGATSLVTPVFDLLVAGMNGDVFAMLIQVADD